MPLNVLQFSVLKMNRPLKSGKLTDILSDQFKDIWQLFSETAFFIGRTREFDQYENQLRGLRLKLQRAKNDKNRYPDIRTEIIEIRRNLRIQGYDLSLAKHSIEFDGFRHDDSMREGFRRVVIFISDHELFWQTGDDNHVPLGVFWKNELSIYPLGTNIIYGIAV
ncbi:hypothetical protein AGMMS49546_19860 [Spirochaetia bacterium]|nr:hypothetical protein AGMMS49546_19860 [Spirochaetia bacterium]